jgi:hypothetical protein
VENHPRVVGVDNHLVIINIFSKLSEIQNSSCPPTIMASLLNDGSFDQPQEDYTVRDSRKDREYTIHTVTGVLENPLNAKVKISAQGTVRFECINNQSAWIQFDLPRPDSHRKVQGRLGANTGLQPCVQIDEMGRVTVTSEDAPDYSVTFTIPPPLMQGLELPVKLVRGIPRVVEL